MQVLLFGPFATVAHGSSVDVELPNLSSTAGEVKAHLAEQYPALRDLLKGAFIAVNHQSVPLDHPVLATDELAVIGQVSGG
jgi:molybdopterin converting factor small subunit